MRFRASALALLVLAFTLVPALPALAGEGGQGIYGKTDDKVVTNFGFGLILLFTFLVCFLSLAQYLLDRRKRSK